MTQSHLIVKEEGIKIYKDDPSSAILCESQIQALSLINKYHFKNNKAFVFDLEIGSIYPVPGIEFEEVEVPEYPIDHTSYPPMIKLARLIEHTAEKESPEIDKEQDELLNFLKWFNDGRWYKDMETFNWRRNFAYKEPEILTSEELVKLYRAPVNLKP